jgi:hypothetical protein
MFGHEPVAMSDEVSMKGGGGAVSNEVSMKEGGGGSDEVSMKKGGGGGGLSAIAFNMPATNGRGSEKTHTAPKRPGL